MSVFKKRYWKKKYAKVWKPRRPETFTHKLGDKKIVMSCPNDRAWERARILFSKEPGTISWIDSMPVGATLWDIGANIGAFSLYAAIARDCPVFAFEPGAANYYGLNTNIILNKLDSRIRAFCVAVDRQNGVGTLNMRDNMIGGSLHVLDSEIDYMGQQFVPAWRQGTISLSIDDLRADFGLPIPHFVKIDVDGPEMAIIEGGKQTLADPACRSVLVEVDLRDEEEVSAISALLEAAGMRRDDNVVGNDPRPIGESEIYNLIFRKP